MDISDATLISFSATSSRVFLAHASLDLVLFLEQTKDVAETVGK